MDNEGRRRPAQINPFSDYGFKRIFGTEPNKDFLIDFINGVLKGERIVKDVSYVKSERLPPSVRGKTIFIDVLCVGDDGSTFVVEMQKMNKDYLLQRLLFYGCRLISGQEHRGGIYNLKAVYVICLLEHDRKGNPNLRSDYSMIREPDGVKELKELKIILFQMAKFAKEPDECLTTDDKWLYLLKNLEYMERLPKEIQSALAERLMGVARIEAMSEEERAAYEKSMMEYDDIESYRDYAKEEGRAEGREEGRVEGKTEAIIAIAKDMKKDGLMPDTISKYTGLTLQEIDNL